MTAEKDSVKNAKYGYDLTGYPSGKYVVKFIVNGETVIKQFVMTSW